MEKKKEESQSCQCCHSGKHIMTAGYAFIILGLFMLLQDLGIISFFKVSGWAILFLVGGAALLYHHRQ